MGHISSEYPVPDVIGVQVYRRDVVVVRESWSHSQLHLTPKRGVITWLSRRSRQRLAFIAKNTPVEFKTLVTLTYPAEFPLDGRDVKRHLGAWHSWLRRHYPGVSYLWFLEFQRRGAPHIHELSTIELPRSRLACQAVYTNVAESWYAIVGSNNPDHLAAGTRTERIRKPQGAARYACKYAYKTSQKAVPVAYQNVGRFWGCSRDVPPQEPEMIRLSEPELRGILADWPWLPADDRTMYRVLFDVADRMPIAVDLAEFRTLQRQCQFDNLSNWV